MIAARHSEGIRAHGTRISWCYTYRLTPQTATPGDMPVKPLREGPARVRMPTHFHPLPQSWPNAHAQPPAHAGEDAEARETSFAWPVCWSAWFGGVWVEQGPWV